MSEPLFATPPAVIGEAVAGRSSTVKAQLESVVGKINEATWDLAALLAEVSFHRYYIAWGYATLGDYVTEVLGIKLRRAQYLIRIVNVCEQLDIPRTTYAPAGVSKMREITTLNPGEMFFNADTKENEPISDHIRNLVSEAPTRTLEEIAQHVRLLKGQVGENERVWLNLSVGRSVRENVIQPAIEMAKARLGSAGRDADGNAVEYSDGSALEVICAEFLADPNNYMPEPDESHGQVDDTETWKGIGDTYDTGDSAEVAAG